MVLNTNRNSVVVNDTVRIIPVSLNACLIMPHTQSPYFIRLQHRVTHLCARIVRNAVMWYACGVFFLLTNQSEGLN